MYKEVPPEIKKKADKKVASALRFQFSEDAKYAAIVKLVIDVCESREFITDGRKQRRGNFDYDSIEMNNNALEVSINDYLNKNKDIDIALRDRRKELENKGGPDYFSQMRRQTTEKIDLFYRQRDKLLTNTDYVHNQIAEQFHSGLHGFFKFTAKSKADEIQKWIHRADEVLKLAERTSTGIEKDRLYAEAHAIYTSVSSYLDNPNNKKVSIELEARYKTPESKKGALSQTLTKMKASIEAHNNSKLTAPSSSLSHSGARLEPPPGGGFVSATGKQSSPEFLKSLDTTLGEKGKSTADSQKVKPLANKASDNPPSPQSGYNKGNTPSSTP